MIRGFIALLATSTDADGRRVPALPASWDVREYNADRWLGIYRDDLRFYFWMRLEVDGTAIGFPTRAVWLVAGEGAVVRAVWDFAVARGLNVWTVAQLRADATSPATIIKTNWPDERPRDENGNPIGTRVALHSTIAGWDITGGTEDTLTVDDLA